jgi:hypothetical protein
MHSDGCAIAAVPSCQRCCNPTIYIHLLVATAPLSIPFSSTLLTPTDMTGNATAITMQAMHERQYVGACPSVAICTCLTAIRYSLICWRN